MNNRYFFSIVYLLLLLIFQLTLIELISFSYFKPDIILIGLIYFTLLNGQIPGIIAAFFIGLLFDIFSGGVVGANSLSKVIAAFIVGYFSNPDANRLEISMRFFVIIFVISLIERIVYIFVAVTLDFKSLLIVMVNNGIIPSIVTLIFSFTVLLLPRRPEVR